jgi:hypothetical protein
VVAGKRDHREPRLSCGGVIRGESADSRRVVEDRSRGVVPVAKLLDAQQQDKRPNTEPSGEAQQPAITGIEAPGFDRSEIGPGDAGGGSELIGGEPPLHAQLADRAPEEAQVLLVGFAAGQENSQIAWKTIVFTRYSPSLPYPLPGECARLRFKMPRKRKSTPRDPELAALGRAIEALMSRGPNTTQTAVADASGLEVKQVGGYVRGQVSPSYRNLLRLCEGLAAKPIELMALVEEFQARERERVPSGVR